MPHLHNTKIGFIGLGLMGRPMARNLKYAGAEVTVFNRSEPAMEELEKEGFSVARSPASAAEDADSVICMVSDTSAVESVLFGDSGVVHGIRTGSVVIDMGTTEVQATRIFARRFTARAVEFVDAPVSGGEVGAIEGTLSIMVGASATSLRRVLPVLQVLGRQVTHIGNVGCGQIAKTANQIIVGLTISAVAEAFAVAKAGGADLNRVWQALESGFAGSRVLELHGKRMIDRNFRPGGTADTQKKDLDQALEYASAIGIDLPSTQLCRNRYEELIQSGHGGLDHSALFHLYSN